MKVKGEIGVVDYKDYRLDKGKELQLEGGGSLLEPTIRYETYGTLNDKKDNAILVIHALTADHHAAGKKSDASGQLGWWDSMIGPGRAFDTNRFFVICSNNLGGCSGTTGPNSINPQTGQPYGLNFPMITVADMAKLQHALMKHLGIEKFYCIAGGSMGGMLALYWSIHYAENVERVVAIATTAAQSAQSIAFSEVARQAIMNDPSWMDGEYFKKGPGPQSGLSIARMLSHITYLSDQSMRDKFGRRLQDKEKFSFSFDVDFQVESYLRYQGNRFVDRFDANSYLYITKALNYFDLKRGFENLSDAFSLSKSRFLVICFSSDWLYPAYMSKELVRSMSIAGQEVSYSEIETNLGHDAFLLEDEKQTRLIEAFLKK